MTIGRRSAGADRNRTALDGDADAEIDRRASSPGYPAWTSRRRWVTQLGAGAGFLPRVVQHPGVAL